MDNINLEEVMKTYVSEQSKDNLLAVLNHLRNAHLFVPSVFPKGTDISAFAKVAPGERLNIPEDVKPIPSILKNEKGEQYLPLYTNKEEIPKNQAYQTLAEITFQAAYTTVLRENSNLEGVALNPFHENIMMKAPLLESLKEQDDQIMENPKNIQLTPEQFVAFVRRDLEIKKAPALLYEKKEEFIHTLCTQKEEFWGNFYKKAYPENMPDGYESNDFSMMILNITEELLFIRTDLPEKNIIPGVCHRIYITWNEKKEQARFFTIEHTQDPETKKLGYVNESGEYIDLGIAPVEGAEIQKILDLSETDIIGVDNNAAN